MTSDKRTKNKASTETKPCDCAMCRTLDLRVDDDTSVILTKELNHAFLNVDDALLKRAYAFIGRNFADVSSTAIKLFLESYTEFHDDTLWLELVIFDGELFFSQVKSEKKEEYFTGGGSSPLEAVMNAIAIAQISPKQ